MKRLHLLLFLWCVLVPIPGVLSLLGFFGNFGVNTAVSGTLAGLWIGGYLVQFAVFMWINNVAKVQSILSWFVASLLPWGFDWILPIHPVSGAPLFLILIGTAWWISATSKEEAVLREHGIRATGVVLEVLKPLMNVVINNVYIKRKVRLRIERRDGAAPYEGVLNGLFMLGEIPSPGERLPLLVDPKNPKHFECDDQAAASSAGTQSSSRPSPSAPKGNSEFTGELERLSKMHQSGELTDAEFASAKKKLLRD